MMRYSKFVTTSVSVVGASTLSCLATKYYLTSSSQLHNNNDNNNTDTTTENFNNNIQKWNYNWDHKQHEYESIPENDRINGRRSITLIRHSQYQRDETGKFKNDHQSLTELGKKQALLTAQRLNDLDMKFDKIYCSKFTRAIETCQIIVNNLNNNTLNDVIYDSDLNEGISCMCEPYSSSWPLDKFIEKMKNEAPAIDNAFNKYFCRRDKCNMIDNDSNKKLKENVLIIGHGRTFRYFIVKILQFDKHGWGRIDTCVNCSIAKINIFDNGTVKVTHWNDCGHLPKQYLTNNRQLVAY